VGEGEGGGVEVVVAVTTPLMKLEVMSYSPCIAIVS
jgi:hypothetical protein